MQLVVWLLKDVPDKTVYWKTTPGSCLHSQATLQYFSLALWLSNHRPRAAKLCVRTCVSSKGIHQTEHRTRSVGAGPRRRPVQFAYTNFFLVLTPMHFANFQGGELIRKIIFGSDISISQVATTGA